MEKKGFLISIEGVDGSGKSTLSHKIKNFLVEKDFDVVVTQEFGGTPLGQRLRQILHEEKELVCDLSEYFLIAADRAQHFEQVVIPALNDKKIVVSDRMGDSSIAYQGYGRGLDIDMIKQVNKWAMQGIEPDLVLYIKLDFHVALERIMLRGGKLTSFETEKELFWKRVSDGYNKLFKDRKNVVEIDGTKSIDELAKAACQIIIDKIILDKP